jgi:hypothetical protein
MEAEIRLNKNPIVGGIVILGEKMALGERVSTFNFKKKNMNYLLTLKTHKGKSS